MVILDEGGGIVKLTTYSGKMWEFMLLLQIMYLFGLSKSSTPESNSSELGSVWVEFAGINSDFPSRTRQSNTCLTPFLSGIDFSTLQEKSIKIRNQNINGGRMSERMN